MIRERDLELGDRRRLHVYDTAGEDAGGLAVFWQHGTPNLGEPPAPLFAAATEHGMRWVSHDRPGYGSSTALPGRDVASVAADVGGIADALGIERFAVVGHSGGGVFALACAALLPDQVRRCASVVGPAPFDACGAPPPR